MKILALKKAFEFFPENAFVKNLALKKTFYFFSVNAFVKNLFWENMFMKFFESHQFLHFAGAHVDQGPGRVQHVGVKVLHNACRIFLYKKRR